MIASKDNKKTYVQVKKYQSREVEASVLRDFYGTITDKLQGEDMGIVITTSICSDSATKFALDKHIKIMNYDSLLNVIKEVAKDHKQELEKFLNDTEVINENYEFKNNVKTCPRCLAPLVWRKE
jgi:hypothetical protein